MRRIRKWYGNYYRLFEPVHYGDGRLMVALRDREQSEAAQRAVLEEMRSLRQRRRAIENQQEAIAGGRR
jgi:hypothetical protein